MRRNASPHTHASLTHTCGPTHTCFQYHQIIDFFEVVCSKCHKHHTFREQIPGKLLRNPRVVWRRELWKCVQHMCGQCQKTMFSKHKSIGICAINRHGVSTPHTCLTTHWDLSHAVGKCRRHLSDCIATYVQIVCGKCQKHDACWEQIPGKLLRNASVIWRREPWKCVQRMCG